MRLDKSLAIALVAAAIGTFLASPAVADPQTDYILNCRGCHRPDGSGVPGGAPDFRGQVGRFLSVPGGRNYLIRVPGTSESELSDERVAALLTWLVREFSPAEVPPDFKPFTAAEVARHRHPPLTDPGRVRAELMRSIEARPPGSQAGR